MTAVMDNGRKHGIMGAQEERDNRRSAAPSDQVWWADWLESDTRELNYSRIIIRRTESRDW